MKLSTVGWLFVASSLNGLLSAQEAKSVEPATIEVENGETHSFQAEVSRLMDIIINSLYSKKEIFIRELISNSADALEKVRFLSLSKPEVMDAQPKLEIQIETNKTAETITFRDTGIGMSKSELIDNLGTVARSGTTNFLEAISNLNSADVNLIGQFGVGFYAAFLVADKVVVASKSTTDPIQHVWISSADAKFTVAPDPRGNTLGRGTEITLHLKPDSLEFLDVNKVESTASRFNQFINYPIFLKKPVEPKAEKEEAKDKEEETLEPKEDEEVKKEELVKDSEKIDEWVHLNVAKPLWLRSKDELNETDYNEFYKSMTKDFSDPLSYIHFSAEGEVDFKSILYIPSHQPFDGWAAYFSPKQNNIKVYARRILVADEAYELLPKWLSFIHGVVDSDDLPLKIDRETLSQTSVMKTISKKLVGKFLDLLKKLSKEDQAAWADYRNQTLTVEGNIEAVANITKPETKFAKFWENFAKPTKVGCVEGETSTREKIAPLLRFVTSKTGPKETITLDEYVERMQENQTSIYYISSEKFEQAMASPNIQYYKQKGLEVLILQDSLDEPCFQRLYNYKNKPLVSVEKLQPIHDMSADQKTEQKKLRQAFKPLTEAMTKSLRGKVMRAQVSNQLVDEVAAIKVESYGNSAFYERVLRVQSFSNSQMGGGNLANFHILEVNPRHPIVKRVLEMVKKDEADPQIQELSNIIHDVALLHSGFLVEKPEVLVRSLNKFVQMQLNVPEDELPTDFDVSDIVIDDNDKKSYDDTDSNEDFFQNMKDDDNEEENKEEEEAEEKPTEEEEIENSTEKEEKESGHDEL